jgi:hypothetical protein
MMPAAIEMPPSPAKGAGMREGTWWKLGEGVRVCNSSESRHVLFTLRPAVHSTLSTLDTTLDT